MSCDHELGMGGRDRSEEVGAVGGDDEMFELLRLLQYYTWNREGTIMLGTTPVGDCGDDKDLSDAPHKSRRSLPHSDD